MGGDHSMRDYGIAAPHGPNRTGDHVATADILNEAVMNKNESEVFKSLLLPDDSYDEAGTYWADMPIWQRIKFVNKVDSAEAKKELKAIGSMMKKDPLSPLGYYMRNMVIPGAGLLLEGYVVFISRKLDKRFTNDPPVTSCSPSETSSLSSPLPSPTAGAHTLSATKPGSNPSNISKSLVSSSVKFLSVSSVTGWVVALV
jgi:hypothetical protein